MMKKIAIFFTLFLMVSGKVVFADNKTVTIASTEWPPFLSAKMDNHGCISKLITDAFASQGYKTNFKYFPWTRNLKMVQTGKLDMALSWIKNVKREEILDFPEHHVASEKYHIFSLKNKNLKFESLEDLKGKSIVVNQSYTYSIEFWDTINQHARNIFYSKDEAQNFNMLLAGRADFTIVEKERGIEELSKLPEESSSRIHMAEVPAVSVYSYLVFSKKSDTNNLREIYDQGHAKVMKDLAYREKYIRDCRPI